MAYGDAARSQALIAAGLGRASAVVLTFLDHHSVLKALATIRDLAPHVPVIVRTYSDRDLDKLRAAGATEVVPEAIEGSLMLASHALALVGVPMRRVIRIVRDQRDARYRLLRGYFHGSDDVSEDELQEERLMTVTLPPEASYGRKLNEVLAGIEALSVVSLRRQGHSLTAIIEDMELDPGDTLLLSGRADALASAERALTR